MGGEDLDLAMTSYDLGLGTGLFPELKLIHLIPASRVSPKYLYDIQVCGMYSALLVNHLHFGTVIDRSPLRDLEKKVRRWIKQICGHKADALYARAAAEAENRFFETISGLRLKASTAECDSR